MRAAQRRGGQAGNWPGRALVVVGVLIASLAAPMFLRYRAPTVIGRRDGPGLT
jgi:hypothetical protein